MQRSFFLLCLQCDGQVTITVDNEIDKFDIHKIRGKCNKCGKVSTLAELGEL